MTALSTVQSASERSPSTAMSISAEATTSEAQPLAREPAVSARGVGLLPYVVTIAAITSVFGNPALAMSHTNVPLAVQSISQVQTLQQRRKELARAQLNRLIAEAAIDDERAVPTVAAVEAARSFIDKVVDSDLALPRLMLADDGEILFFARDDEIYIDVGTQPDGSLSYFAEYGGRKYSADDVAAKELPADIIDLLTKLGSMRDRRRAA